MTGIIVIQHMASINFAELGVSDSLEVDDIEGINNAILLTKVITGLKSSIFINDKKTIPAKNNMAAGILIFIKTNSPDYIKSQT